MPMTEPAKRVEQEQMRFELEAEMQYPFLDLPPQLNMAITRFWRTKQFFWLRLEHPDSGEEFDFRVIKIYRSPEAVHVAIAPARRWNAKRTLRAVTALSVPHQTVLRSLSDEELGLLKDSLHLDESFQLNGTDPDYLALFEDQVLKTFGPCSYFDQDKDLQFLEMIPEIAIGGTLMKAGREVEVDVDTTVNEPGSLRLVVGAYDVIFRILAFHVVNGRMYLAVQPRPEQNAGLSRIPVTVMELKSKHFVRVLSAEELQAIAAGIMDACEQSRAR